MSHSHFIKFRLCINLSLFLSVCVAAALVIVSAVADQANDNLKQGVSLLWIHSTYLSLSHCLGPVDVDIFTAQCVGTETRLCNEPGNERLIFRWTRSVRKIDS